MTYILVLIWAVESYIVCDVAFINLLVLATNQDFIKKWAADFDAYDQRLLSYCQSTFNMISEHNHVPYVYIKAFQTYDV